jgi:hypothetical protein
VIPQSCPLSDKDKLKVVLNLKCYFALSTDKPLNEYETWSCRGCSFTRTFQEWMLDRYNEGKVFDHQTTNYIKEYLIFKGRKK